MQSLVLTLLDYGNATLADLPGQVIASQLQSVLHAAARLIYSKRKYEHVTPLLMDLHWLSVHERLQFMFAVCSTIPCQPASACTVEGGVRTEKAGDWLIAMMYLCS